MRRKDLDEKAESADMTGDGDRQARWIVLTDIIGLDSDQRLRQNDLNGADGP